MIAVTDERIEGARGIHDLDVAVRSKAAGIDQLWVIECKRWKARVNKAHVATLAEIVKDVGADRGILLSESGFQAGAIRMARLTNITLSSVPDLEENSEEERIKLRLYGLRQQLAEIRSALGNLTTHELGSDGRSATIRAALGSDLEAITVLLGFASGIDSVISNFEMGRWPIHYFECDLTRIRPRIANSTNELLEGLNKSVQLVGTQIDQLANSLLD